MRLKQRSSVDLPQPDGPMMAVTRFAAESHVDVLERLALPIEEAQALHLGFRSAARRRLIFGRTPTATTSIVAARPAPRV